MISGVRYLIPKVGRCEERYATLRKWPAAPGRTAHLVRSPCGGLGRKCDENRLGGEPRKHWPRTEWASCDEGGRTLVTKGFYRWSYPVQKAGPGHLVPIEMEEGARKLRRPPLTGRLQSECAATRQPIASASQVIDNASGILVPAAGTNLLFLLVLLCLSVPVSARKTRESCPKLSCRVRPNPIT